MSLSTKIRLALWGLFIVGGAALSLFFDLRYFPHLLTNPLFHLIAFIAGIIVGRFAFKAAAVGGRELARHGRVGNIPRLETNRLVTSGIYSCMRHPMLFGLMLLPLAFALVLGLPTFIFFIAPLEALIILLLVLTLEEKEAYKKFGKAYDEYKKKVPAFPKSLECLKRLFV